jgi:hypothetical protein
MDASAILKWILRKQNMRILTGFSYIIVGA